VPSWNGQIITFALPTKAKAVVAKAKVQSNIVCSSNGYNETNALPDGSISLRNQMSPAMVDRSQIFDTHDVFLLMRFTSTTSGDLLGSQQLWIKDVIQLAFQVWDTGSK
jgi:hypothetical protein